MRCNRFVEYPSTHNQECYAIYGDEVLTCDGSFIHRHDGSCYDESGNLICGKADFVLHKHDESCYDDEGNLICSLPQVDESLHEDIYYESPDVTCVFLDYNDTHNHIHNESCYAITETLNCGMEQGTVDNSIVLHSHGAECYEHTLTCGIADGDRLAGTKTDQGGFEGSVTDSGNTPAIEDAPAEAAEEGAEPAEALPAAPHVHDDSWHLDSLSRMSCIVGPGNDAISVKNIYTPKGSLLISKQVVDTDGTSLSGISDVFKFNIRFTEQDGSDCVQPLSCIVYDGSGSRFATSKITSPCVIEIPANGYAVIDGFAGEVQYSVAEVSCDNYKLVSSEGASGTISTKQETAKFVNCYNPGGPELPATGGPGTFRLMIAGMSLLLLAFCEIRRRYDPPCLKAGVLRRT
jgi:hypothetical protein